MMLSMCGAPSRHIFSIASSTEFHASEHASIWFGIFVSIPAVCLVLCLGLFCQNCRPVTDPTADVFKFSNGFEVVRIDAASDATQMIYFKPFRYRSLVLSVGYAMRHFHDAAAQFDTAISTVSDSAQPKPASCFRNRNRKVNNSLKYGKLGDERHCESSFHGAEAPSGARTLLGADLHYIREVIV